MTTTTTDAAEARADLLSHVRKMQEACASYLEPTTYHARHPDLTKVGDCKWVHEFEMPDPNASEAGVSNAAWRRDQAFIRDIIYMLDGPEQRAAFATAEAASGAGERKWRPFIRQSDVPTDGTWFVARSTRPGWEAVRVVRYADKSHRLPIDGTGWLWPSEPTEWLPVNEFAASLPPATDSAMVEQEGKPDYEPAWREMYDALSWMHGCKPLAGYAGWPLGKIANDLIDQAYPGLRAVAKNLEASHD